MRRSVILDTSIRLEYHPVLVLSLYLLFAGHNQPGGGFVGGLVAGIAIALRFIAGGIDEVRAALPARPWSLLGLGLVVASVTAVVPLAFGGALLEAGKLQRDAPLLGTIKTTTALFFDIGVYLVVVGLVLMMFEAFGEPTAPPVALLEDGEGS